MPLSAPSLLRSLALLGLIGLLGSGPGAAVAADPVAADPAQDPASEGDVVASLEILAEREVLREHLSDLRNYRALWSEACVMDLEVGDKAAGVGANATLTYRGEGLWRRKLAAVITDVRAERVTLDHPGKKGFPTTFDLRDGAQGVVVEMHTWINPPPKPFQKTYFKRTQPHWQQCQQEFLRNLARAVTTSSP